MPEIISTYCNYVSNLERENVHRIYHDTQYGFPIESDNELFGRLILEINQAGLSWDIILNKEANFRVAYDHFNITKVANYSEKDETRLLSNAGIIRNKLKIKAVIYNAQQIELLRKEHGTFKNWLDINHPKPKKEWIKLFKKTFKFTGGEITSEFLMSTGYLAGAHSSDCPIYKEVQKTNPMWFTNPS
jgi:DNA-3-methyladenine glycosylase I